MLTRQQKEVIRLLTNNPLKVAHWLGFDKLTELHNKWMCDFINREDDMTLQGHRGSYKTTCISVVLAILMILQPHKDIGFVRKTDTDVQEIIKQVKNILLSDTMQYLAFLLQGSYFTLTTTNSTQLSTSLRDTTRGTIQLLGLGTGGSITGKHFDIIFTDDIVNLSDRMSTAERNRTKSFYMELQNVKNRGGRFVNTGTPWHKDDAFSIMPEAEQYDCYSTGLITAEELQKLRDKMSNSLFSANYELKHIADEEALFKSEPKFFNDLKLIENGIGHIDASYGGADSTAFTLGKKVGENIYLYGIRRDRHIDECIGEFILLTKNAKCGTIYVEDNGDKGYLCKEIIKNKHFSKTYHESMNKYVKIATYLKGNWENVYFYDKTDAGYLQQILDYTEQAEHDDCPDSASSIIRQLTNNSYVIV